MCIKKAVKFIDLAQATLNWTAGLLKKIRSDSDVSNLAMVVIMSDCIRKWAQFHTHVATFKIFGNIDFNYWITVVISGRKTDT